MRQSDVLDVFNLLTVLYKLDTATWIVHICPAVIGTTGLMSVSYLHISSLGFLSVLPSISMSLS